MYLSNQFEAYKLLNLKQNKIAKIAIITILFEQYIPKKEKNIVNLVKTKRHPFH